MPNKPSSQVSPMPPPDQLPEDMSPTNWYEAQEERMLDGMIRALEKSLSDKGIPLPKKG